jgi:hypothetical protein
MVTMAQRGGVISTQRMPLGVNLSRTGILPDSQCGFLFYPPPCRRTTSFAAPHYSDMGIALLLLRPDNRTRPAVPVARPARSLLETSHLLHAPRKRWLFFDVVKN